MKFGRQYLIQILTPQNELIEITPPFSAEIDVQRNTLASTNTASVIIYNLAPKTRGKIFKDRYTTVEYWQLVIWAGYKTLSKIFQGNIYESQSSKQGPDWQTKIEAFDGLDAIQNGYTATTIVAETQRADIIRGVISDMPNVLAGILGSPADGSTSRGQALLGPSVSVLSDQTDGQYFIDNEIVNVIDSEEVIGESVLVLDEDQLFSTPRRRETFLDIEILLTPEVSIGNVAEVRSREAIYDGQYKVMGFGHTVQIFGSVGGEARTAIALYAGAEGLREVS